MNVVLKPKQFETAQTPSQSPVLSPAVQDGDFMTLLNQNLANIIDLRSRTKQAHWNAKGGRFYALHKLLDDFSDNLDSIADELGERILVLGGVAQGAPQQVARNSTLPLPPAQVLNADHQIDHLVNCIVLATQSCQRALLAAIRADHQATAAILTGLARLLNSQHAILSAHIVPSASSAN